MTDVTQYPHPLIAREGWFYLTISVSSAVLATALGAGGWSIPFWVVAVFVLQFFRDPARVPAADARAVASPADGRVVFVGAAKDPVTGNDSLKISVFMNVFNVHSNRAPVAGQVRQVSYFPGRFFNADLDKASTENERNAIVIRDSKGRELTCIQIAGLVARRILCYVQEGDLLQRGMRYGFIRFGSRVDIYMPVGSRPLVTLQDKVSAHSTALALWPDDAQDAGHAKA